MSYGRTNYRRRTSSSGAGSRWMSLRYAGACKVCGNQLPAGTRAYWDSGAKTVTCSSMDCARADGLTETVLPTGPWDKFDSREQLRERRLGAGAPAPVRINTIRFSSGAAMYQNARGRCEDAPCCGCCS